jgi:uncharacterized LabA/DUF88 family protein
MDNAAPPIDRSWEDDYVAKKKKDHDSGIRVRPGGAKPHPALADDFVHLFVDDQNLFWGIVNQELGPGYRIDFGQLALIGARTAKGEARGIRSAYIAGVIPDDDSFWKIAENQGFTVRRGFLGAGSRSKQDDAYLITDIVVTLYEQPGPSTIVLVAGDADYRPPLGKAIEKGWRSEVAFIRRGISAALEPVVHEFRTILPSEIQYNPEWRR